MISDIATLTKEVVSAYHQCQRGKLFTVAISSIDASGKGFITQLLQKTLEEKGYSVATINIDPWQNPIPVRLKKENAAENLYENIFRWKDFFGQLIFPLQENKSITLTTNLIRTDADIYYPYTYYFQHSDILLIEGILLFRKEYLTHYDLRVWIDCSFETGLKRALQRNVEKLDPDRLVSDYHTFYYAAQRLHFQRDDPKAIADIIYDNDVQLSLR